jgi:hypothetical protein
VVLHNTGSAPLAVGPCTIGGSDRFRVTTSCTNISIAPFESATLMVEYDPALEAHDVATLTIGVDALSTNQVAISLAGTGADQRLDLSTLDVAFPDANVDMNDKPIAYVDVHNPVNPETGVAEPLHIASATVDNDVFTLANMGPFTVEGDAMIRLAITFAPTHAGTFDGTLTLTSDTSTQPMAQITLHGRGVLVGAPEGGCCDTRQGRSSTPRSTLLLALFTLAFVLRARASRR